MATKWRLCYSGSWNRHAHSPASTALRAQLPSVQWCVQLADLPPADIVVLGVRDDAIEIMAMALADSVAIQSNTTVLHFSGARSSQALSALADHTSLLGSLHPVFAFADANSAQQQLSGHLCAFEGAFSARPVLQALAHHAGLHAFEMSAAHKARYHAAMSVSANFLVTLNYFAQQMLAPLALPNQLARQLVNQLMTQNLAQLEKHPPEAVLTGPIQRGDAQTIAIHWATLTREEQVVYRILAEETIKLAQLASEKREEILVNMPM